MNTLDQIRIITVPTWLRWVGFGFLASILALNIFVIYLGFLPDSRGGTRFEFWIPAGSALLSVTLPVIGIVALFAFSDVGLKALESRTAHFLLQVMPRQLATIHRRPAEQSLYFSGRRKPTSAPVQYNQISVGHMKTECAAVYLVPLAPGDEPNLRLRLEVNVKRANLAITMPAIYGLDQKAEEVVPHTIQGALGAGWLFNQNYRLRHNQNDAEAMELVFFRDLERDFLWDVAAQLFLAQDIRLMIRSLISEFGEDIAQTAKRASPIRD